MKKLPITLSLIILSALSIPAQAADFAPRTIGLNGGYSTRGESGVAGIFFKYRFSRHFTLAPSVDYVFKHNNLDGYAFNINTNYPVSLGREGLNFYPLAGVNVSSWNRRAGNDDSSSRTNRIGLNVGGGFEMAVTPTLSVSLEAYYNWVSRLDGAYIKASIGYNF